MKIGTETNSLLNHVLSRSVIGEPFPQVGMGVTLLHWTDRMAGTINKVEEIAGGRSALYIIWVTEDWAEVIAGSQHDGSAEYRFTPHPEGPEKIYRKSKKTLMWDQVRRNPETGRLVLAGGSGIRIGSRDKYVDPSF